MRRRFISMVLTLALIVSLLATLAPAAQAVEYSGQFGRENSLEWRLDTVTGRLDITPRTLVEPVIPDYGGNYNNAPWHTYRTSIRTVVIDSRITRIGNYSFSGAVNLTAVQAIGVQTIGAYAFNECTALINLNMPVSMPAVTNIGSFAFNECRNLATISLPAAINEIGTGAFAGCRRLGAISINGVSPAVSTGGKFEVDDSGVLLENNAGGDAIRVVKARINLPGPTYQIPVTVVSIDPTALAYSELETITIPAGVNTIGRDAFSWNPRLREATFNGHAPQNIPSQHRQLFENVASGFRILYFPYTQRWPTGSQATWMGYTVVAKTSFVTLDRSAFALEIGATTRLQATVHPANSSQAVSWTSDNPAVATVSPEGIVRAIATGSSLITATSSGGESATSRVQVVQRVFPVTSVVLNTTQLTLELGSPAQLPILTAVVYPFNATVQDLRWESSNLNIAYVESGPGLNINFQRMVVPVSPGTVTITARSADGNIAATCTVTVVAAKSFVPVTSISLSAHAVAMGATINLNNLATVHPANATNDTVDLWEILDSLSTITTEMGAVINNSSGVLTVPWGQTGTVVVEATVLGGMSDGSFTQNPSVPYIQRFTISVVSFLPVTGIVDVPQIAYAGVPLELRGTVLPVGAAYRDIQWSLGTTNTARAYIDPLTGRLVAHEPGVVRVIATVNNGVMTGSPTSPTLTPFTFPFDILVVPYTASALTLNAEPGGSVSGTGPLGGMFGVGGAAQGQFAGGEVITITATPNQGWIFAGWRSSNGGSFSNHNNTTTQFTMPGNATTVTALFNYTGLTHGGGTVTQLPTPVHYFTNNSVYFRDSNVSFGHVSVRDFHLFSNVTLDGRTLTRDAHYTARRVGGFTEIVLNNGYLNSLHQGSHTLTIHFQDYVTVTAVFTVIWQAPVSTTFRDVYESDWFFSSVGFVTDRGWMTARAATPREFRPSAPVTQGEVIDALYRMAGSPSIVNQFGQVLQGRAASHEWVRANGIMPLGGVYSLDSVISRQDIALLFGRMVNVLRIQYPVIRGNPSFADEWQIDPLARGAVNDMFRAGIIGGRTASTFVPLGNSTRAEFATMLQRFSDAVGRW